MQFFNAPTVMAAEPAATGIQLLLGGSGRDQPMLCACPSFATFFFLSEYQAVEVNRIVKQHIRSGGG